MKLIKYENKFIEQKLGDLATILYPNYEEIKSFQLVISINCQNINAKELGDLFYLIYRIDGKYSELGFHSYAQRKDRQITSNFRTGSLEIVLDTLSNNINPQSLLVIWLTFKYLPNLVNSFSGALLNFTSSLNQYAEYQRTTSEVRRGRKELRELIYSDYELEKVTDNNKEKIVKLLEEIYTSNQNQLPGAIRLLRKKLKKIFIKTK